MEIIHQNEKSIVTLHDEGFVEVVVAEGGRIAFPGIDIVTKALQERGFKSIRVLIVRQVRYTTAEDIYLRDLSHLDGIVIERVAYHAPGPFAQTASHVVGLTALRNVEYRVFVTRDEALAWLLSD